MLLLATTLFVGSAACRPCHAAIADQWAGRPMARSSGRVESIAPATFTAAGHRYRIAAERLQFGGGSLPFSFFVGSNTEGRSYLWARDGYLFELPVTWYAGKKVWDASPGYGHDEEIRLTRPVEPGCLQCHSSQVRPVLGTQNRYGDPPFQEGGVGCERCHGPGSDHVRDPSAYPMVNPAKLESDRRDSVCSQCHLSGEARIERAGKRMAQFRAGDRLSDFATYFVSGAPGSGDLKVTSHVEKLAASACKAGAGERLWCGSCHDAHDSNAARLAAKTQSACAGCHAGAHRQSEACVACHMPRAKAIDAGGHGVMTDHSIPRLPGRPVSEQSRDLVAFLGPGDDRALGLAYAELGDARARGFLQRAEPVDWAVRLWLAVLERDPARAAPLYAAVLADRPGDTAALVNLGSLRAGEGKLDEAAALWERALAANPAIDEAVLNLAQVRPRAQAIKVLQRYLEFNPVSGAARARLRSLTITPLKISP